LISVPDQLPRVLEMAMRAALARNGPLRSCRLDLFFPDRGVGKKRVTRSTRTVLSMGVGR
jgi:hypothetical protein